MLALDRSENLAVLYQKTTKTDIATQSALVGAGALPIETSFSERATLCLLFMSCTFAQVTDRQCAVAALRVAALTLHLWP